jgi:hypothetical protein
MFLHLARTFTLPLTLLLFYYILRARFSENVSLSQASSSPIFRSLSRCHLSCTAWARPRNLTGGNRRCRKDKRQKTKHTQSWGQVGWALRWRHTTPPPSPVSLLYIRRDSSPGREHDIAIFGNRRNLWPLFSECKYLRKNSCAASCPLLRLGPCQTQPAVYLTQLCLCTLLSTEMGSWCRFDLHFLYG